MAHKILAKLGVALPQKETKLGSKIDCSSAERAMIPSTRHPELLTSPCPSCRMDSPTTFPSSALPEPCCANSASLSWSGIVMPRATGKRGCLLGLGTILRLWALDNRNILMFGM